MDTASEEPELISDDASDEDTVDTATETDSGSAPLKRRKNAWNRVQGDKLLTYITLQKPLPLKVVDPLLSKSC